MWSESNTKAKHAKESNTKETLKANGHCNRGKGGRSQAHGGEQQPPGLSAIAWTCDNRFMQKFAMCL